MFFLYRIYEEHREILVIKLIRKLHFLKCDFMWFYDNLFCEIV